MKLTVEAAFRLCFVRLYSISSSTTARKPAISQKVKFIDQLRIFAKGGHGGGGSSALFGRTGHYPRAAGGNGAPGGAVILRATRQLTGLGSIPLHVEGARGGNGGKQWMDGKKGADRVVAVPLGTLVWQLLETSQGPASRPHGVTPLPASMQGQPAGGGAAVTGGTSGSGPPAVQHHQAMQSAGAGSCADASSSSSSGSSGRGSSRPRLFAAHVQQHDDGGAELAGTAAAAAAAVDPDPSASTWSMTQNHHGRLGDDDASSSFSLDAAAAAEAGHSTDALYQQLLSGKRLLSNAEKLALLHTGRLPEAAAGGPGPRGDWGVRGCWGAGDWAGDVQREAGSSSAEEEEASDDGQGGGRDVWTGEGWAGAGDDPAAAAAGGGGFEPEEVERQFTKRQVWSILESQAVLLCELDEEGQQVRVALGGRGGRGNAVSPSKPHGPASRARTDGEPGQEVMLLLKLRLLADVVLVGLPNVGKSSLIAALTHARAQIGSYAFTTLRPQLGTITDTTPLADSSGSTSWDHGQLPAADAASQGPPAAVNGTQPGAQPTAGASAATAAAVAAAGHAAVVDDPVAGQQQLVIADLPGLVPGAHTGKGRGTAFLAHLQRARCIALVLDMTGGGGQQGGRQPAADRLNQEAGMEAGGGSSELDWGVLVPYTAVQQLEILQEELSRFDAKVLQLPMIVVANKLDALAPAASAAALQQLKAATTMPIVPVSAKQGLGLQRLKSALQLIAGR